MFPKQSRKKLGQLGQEAEWENRTIAKEMATHSSILAWRIPGTEAPGMLQLTGLQRVGQN